MDPHKFKVAAHNAQLIESIKEDIDTILGVDCLSDLATVNPLEICKVRKGEKHLSGHAAVFDPAACSQSLQSTSIYDFGGNFMWPNHLEFVKKDVTASMLLLFRMSLQIT